MGMNLKFLNFKFDSDEAIASSFEQQAIYNRILELFILASVSCLSVKNKKGIDLRELCELLSNASVSWLSEEIHVSIAHLSKNGFLRFEKSLDRDGDKSALMYLVNKKVGEYSEAAFKQEFPELSTGIDKLKEFDFDAVFKKASEMKASDTKH